MNIKKIKEYKSAVSYFKINNNGLVVVDEENRIYVYDNEFKLKNGFKIKLPKNKVNENTIDVSDDFKYLLLSVPKYPLSLWDIENKKLLQKYEWHQGDVLSVKIKDDYFLSGGMDGKIFLYSVPLKKMVSRIAKYKDFISALDMDDEEVFAGSFDSAVIFADLSSLSMRIRKLHLHKVIKIINEKFLVSSSEKSDLIKWDRLNRSLKDKLTLYLEIRDFCIYENYLFVLIKNRVVLYDLQNEILINDNFYQIEGSKISVFNDCMFIAEANVLYKINLIDENELLEAIIDKDYKSAYEIVINNPFLKKSKAYEKLKILYKLTIKKALKYYEIDEKTKAYELLKPFMNVLSKKEEILKIIEHFDNFIKFKKAYENKNYALLYQLADMYELLKNTKYYKLVEREWESVFEKAKNEAINGNVNRAKELLKNFLPVSQKKALINTLLQQAELFKLLKEKIAKKDFKGFFAIIKTHPELKDTKEYKTVMEYANKLYLKAKEALEKENFDVVLRVCEILEDIDGFELKAKELREKTKIILEFLRVFNEDKNKAFEMIEKYPFLKDLSVYKIYQEKWRKKLQKAEDMAFHGKIKEALNTLKEYENIKSKKPRIKNMLKSAYLNYIKQSKDKNAIEKYIATFGSDEEIEKLKSNQ